MNQDTIEAVKMFEECADECVRQGRHEDAEFYHDMALRRSAFDLRDGAWAEVRFGSQ